MDVKTFAKRFYVALAEDHWGDIDPYWFKLVAEGIPLSDMDGDTFQAVDGLKVALEKALKED